MQVRRLVDFPYVLVRLRCELCKRAGSYRLARLAVKYGSEVLLDHLIVRLSADCPWWDDPWGSGCGARFADLPPGRPPDMPVARRLRVVAGGKTYLDGVKDDVRQTPALPCPIDDRRLMPRNPQRASLNRHLVFIQARK